MEIVKTIAIWLMLAGLVGQTIGLVVLVAAIIVQR